MRIAVFSGTTEGRKLSEMLSAATIRHLVLVATEYGNDVMEKNEYADVHVGRLDKEQMLSFLKDRGFVKGDLIVDATHPYASEVSANIANAADQLECEIVRVERQNGVNGYCNNGYYDNSNIKSCYVNQYLSFEEFISAADHTDGNILLTTGSKELEKYCGLVSKETLMRTYARVLPAVESLEICEKLGIDKTHIIAMHGPFTYELNRALMAQYDIKHLVTKDSGAAGGFSEKIKAAEALGVTVHIISRPENNVHVEGVTVEEAFARITGSPRRLKRRIVLAGIGMGALSGMTMETVDAIRNSDAVFGAKRLLEAVKSAGLISKKEIFEMYLAKDIIGVLEREVNITKPTILFSGDTGFYSGAKEAYRQLKEWDSDADIAILPGISSVSYLAAKLGESYDDAAIVSVHGRNSLHNIEKLVNSAKDNRKTFALMSGDEDVRIVANMLSERGIAAKIVIGRDMSYVSGHGTDHETEILDVETAKTYSENGLITVLFINDDAE